MKLLKKITALATVAAMGISMIGFSASAENVNYYQNWTSDNGDGPANGSSNGIHGNTVFNSTIDAFTGFFEISWNTTQSGFKNLAGVGWNLGKANRKIGYNLGIFSHTSGSNGYSHATFLGWTKNPLVEYQIFENWFNYVPNDGVYVGTYSTDGSTYKFYYKNVNGPSIDGSIPYKQVISIRNSSRNSGIITLQNHVNAWASNPNTKLGSVWSYQSFCVEGFNSSGKAYGSVWEAN